ncbi:hypothetical protein [Microbulbifer halophilus]|uniref:Uncharacterized protein n=2 Tax=Microbulbifer halophilus TaxID=453963 RepID=A0ABW5EF10_9GAMM|nr:hypothetical protein [Microbulbifer halophilus]MCW8127695.1 hypothetical protein [Microbulbifer halophilus]
MNISENEIFILKEGEDHPKSWLSYNVQFSDSLNDGTAKTFVRKTFLFMLLETFESAQKYANKSGKFSEFASQEWYPFARHLRNAIGHNGVWDIRGNPKDFPTTFRNKTIDASLNGRDLGDFVGWVYGLQLCASVSSWVSNS